MPFLSKKAENQHGIPVAKLLFVVAAKWCICFTFCSVAVVSMEVLSSPIPQDVMLMMLKICPFKMHLLK